MAFVRCNIAVLCDGCVVAGITDYTRQPGLPNAESELYMGYARRKISLEGGDYGPPLDRDNAYHRWRDHAGRISVMGMLFALCSVILVSVAQLAMKYAMEGMPSLLNIREFFYALVRGSESGYYLFLGLLCYGLSMFLWFLALRLMELGKAYSLLSLSYAVVWLMALFIPDIHESYSLSGLVGVCFIIAGVALIHFIKKDN